MTPESPTPAQAGRETDDDPVVGHKTFLENGEYSHKPLFKSEADALMRAIEVNAEKRRAAMPDERSAINSMFNAYQRLSDFGWREAMYCPKDGTSFYVIEAGSIGIHTAHYSGEWPDGCWWIESDGDLWPSRPILFKEKDRDER